MFSDAYRTIGAADAADALDQAVSMFGFSSAHKHRTKRNHFLDAEQKRPGKFSQLSKRMCGDKKVWELLGRFVAEHASVFKRKAQEAGCTEPRDGPSVAFRKTVARGR